jgi:adhesin transport system outer membrane protein
MLRFKHSWCLALLLLATGSLYAQVPDKSITLKDLLKQVAQNAPTLLADSSAILIREAQARETGFNWLPNLKLNYQADIGTNNNTGGPYFGFGIVPSNSRGVREESNTTAVMTNLGIAAFDMELYNFGAYKAQNKVAGSEVAVQQRQFDTSKYNLQAYTIDNYLQLLRLQEFITVQLRNIERNQEIRRSIRALAKSGIRAGVDTSIAEAELSKSRLNYIELKNQAKQVQLKLSAISGMPYQAIVPDTTAERKLFGQSAESRLFYADTTNHPVIRYYQSLYENSLQREDLVKKSYNPKISLQAAAWGRAASLDANNNFTSLRNGWGFQRENYLVGLGISYNLFDLKRRQLKLNTQKITSQYTLRKLNEQKVLLAASASQADANVATALERLQEIPKQLKAANAAYRQKFSLYKSGLTDIIELNAALALLYRAEVDFISAKFSYTQALFQKAVTENQVSTVINLLN